jgi:hypothetical protein
MSVVIQMPRRPKSEAVEVLEELLGISLVTEPSGIILMAQFPAGTRHVGASGKYLRDQKCMDEALFQLSEYFRKQRAVT